MNGSSLRWMIRVQSIILLIVAGYAILTPPDPCKTSCAIVWQPFTHPDPTAFIVGAILAVLGIVGLIRSFSARAG